MNAAQSKKRGEVAFYSGDAAEQIVARDYEARGLTVAHRRWRGAGGEIDLIARDGEQIVFVEVKKSRTRSRAAERISARQVARIQASAGAFLASEPLGQLTEVRFDVALVDALGSFEIIENAFGHD